jgi:glycosyl transferase family 87
MDSSSATPRLGTACNDGTLGLAAIAILLAAFVVWAGRGSNIEKTDFALSYVAAHMVHAGIGQRLYDADLQIQLRDSMFRQPSPLYFEHPPFEALLLSPLAAFSFRTAYLIWGLLNAAIVMGLLVYLRPHLKWPSEDLGYIALWLLFAPILVTLYQGQSSILVLAGFALAFVQLKKERPFSAGVALALSLFKFQFAVPMAIIFLLRRQWRLLAGFASSGAVLALISLFAVGRGGLLDYIRFLTRIGGNPRNVSYGSAVDMPTLHGLLYALLGSRLNGLGLSVVVAILSIALLMWTAWNWKASGKSAHFDLLFSGAMAASLLSGSHMFTQDFSPLILGMLLSGIHLSKLLRAPQVMLVGSLVVFWSFPLYFLFVKWHCMYVMAIAMLAFVWACVHSQNYISERSAPASQTVAAV